MGNPDTPTTVEDLRPGDMIDLEDDPYADPDQDSARHIVFECEYAVVIEPPEQETPDCTLVHTDAGSFGFPRGHLVPRSPDRSPDFEEES
jgi:hypothetical protein